MSDEYQVDALLVVRMIKVLVVGSATIIVLVIYCCRRQRRNTERVQSLPVVHQSHYNAVPLPQPPTTRTNLYQAPYIHPPQPTSNAPSEPYADDFPPSYDQVCGKQPPCN